MQKSLSWENNRISANQGISRILWNPKDHYRIHKCPPPIPILSQFHPVHTLISYCLNIHLNIITPPTPGSPKCSLSHRFVHQNPVYASPVLHTRYLPCLTHSSRVYHQNNIGWAVPIIQLLIMHLQIPCYLFTLSPNILFSTLFSNALSLRSSLNVNDQVSHPYKTTGITIFMYILMYKSLDSKLEDKRFCTEW